MNSYVFLTIQKGKKQYFAHVSSFSYVNKNLWLFVHSEDGISGNCGYIPNGRVISASVSALNHPSVSEGTAKIIHAWQF